MMNLRFPATALLLGWLLSAPNSFSADSVDSSHGTSSAVQFKTEYLDVPYVTDGHTRQKLDLFLPNDTSKSHPLLIWIHGGAWEAGSKDRCPAKAMVQRGYAVASLNYRLSQHATYPAQLQGGHLVALLGTTGHLRDFDVGEYLEQSSRVQCVIDWFGPTDFLNYGQAGTARLEKPGNAVTRLLGGNVDENLDRARLASPVYFVRRDAAPFLIMQGDRDLLVPAQQSELPHAALQKAGVESELKILKGAGHGGASFSSPENLKLMAEFCDQHLLRSTLALK